MNANLLFYDCRLSGGDNHGWQGHSNLTWNFLKKLLFALTGAGMQKHLAPALVPRGGGDTKT